MGFLWVFLSFFPVKKCACRRAGEVQETSRSEGPRTLRTTPGLGAAVGPSSLPPVTVGGGNSGEKGGAEGGQAAGERGSRGAADLRRGGNKELQGLGDTEPRAGGACGPRSASLPAPHGAVTPRVSVSPAELVPAQRPRHRPCSATPARPAGGRRREGGGAQCKEI